MHQPLMPSTPDQVSASLATSDWMASTLHTIATTTTTTPLHPTLPSSGSRTSTTSSAYPGGPASSTSGYFDTSASVVSTPASTPQALSNGSMSYYPRSSQGHGEIVLQQFPAKVPAPELDSMAHAGSGHRPQIYTAVYSGVSVYEMEVNHIAVMRRRSDSWLNATQILKVAGIEKGKRTKVLEKEILAGEHEKVQGGYGKYQGTWINYQRGLEFCRQYGVEALLRPLLEYDMGQDGMTAAGSGRVETPTKEQAMAANRKRLYNAGIENRPAGQSANGTFFKNISSTASNAVAAITKARFDSPGPRSGTSHRRPGSVKRQSSQQLGSQESFAGGSQQSMASLASESSFGATGNMDSTYGTQNVGYLAAMHDPARHGDVQEPPRKKVRPSPSLDHLPADECMYDMSMTEGGSTQPLDPAVYGAPDVPSLDAGVVALEPLPPPTGKAAEEKVGLLLSLFLDPSQTDFSRHPAFARLSSTDLDLPLDGTAHTALHWAATLARMPLLRALIARGASIVRVNGGGETALIRACVVTNNLDQGSFPELLEMLGPTIEMRDGRGRTVLHHIAVSSAVKGRSSASRYYLESLLEFVVRQGSAPSSQQNSFSSPAAAGATMKAIGLGRFMSEIVNAQDKSGDTALNIAARIGNRSIIQQMLEVGADAGIPNRAGLKPLDFGVGKDGEMREPPSSSQHRVESPERTVSRVVGETSQDIISSMSSLLSETEKEFASEMRAKQDLIDATHAQLRECSAQLGEERRRLEALQRKATERSRRQEKMANLLRTSQEQRQRLQQQHNGLVNGDAAAALSLQIGDADLGLHISTDDLPPTLLDHPRVEHLTPHQYAYLASLPAPAVLRARHAAYSTNNASLRAHAARLKSHSSDLEAKYRRVVSLCTGAPEAEVDKLLRGLVEAIESEGGVDLMETGRLRDFLRRVEGV